MRKVIKVDEVVRHICLEFGDLTVDDDFSEGDLELHSQQEAVRQGATEIELSEEGLEALIDEVEREADLPLPLTGALPEELARQAELERSWRSWRAKARRTLKRL